MTDREKNRFSARARRYASVGANVGGVAARMAGARFLGRDLDRGKNAAELAAALGGLETLVFSGGIGESAAVIRERICEGLGFLGLEIDRSRNEAHAGVISRGGGRVTVRVIPTNEQVMIARSVLS